MSLVGSWLFLLTKLSMFGKLEVHVLEVVWRFEPITFYIGSLRVKLILATTSKYIFDYLYTMEGSNTCPPTIMLSKIVYFWNQEHFMP